MLESMTSPDELLQVEAGILRLKAQQTRVLVTDTAYTGQTETLVLDKMRQLQEHFRNTVGNLRISAGSEEELKLQKH